MLAILIIAVVTDLRETRISNRLITSGLILGLAFRIVGAGVAGVVHFLVNISIPVIFLFLLFQLRVLGAGDIKLFSVIAGFLTIRQTLYVMIAAFVAGGAIGMAKLLYLRVTTGRFGEGRTLIHFSTAILIGYLFVVWGCAIE